MTIKPKFITTGVAREGQGCRCTLLALDSEYQTGLAFDNPRYLWKSTDGPEYHDAIRVSYTCPRVWLYRPDSN